MPSAVTLTAALVGLICGLAQAQEKKPNILVIFGDDIGQSNISAYTFGLMGYKTPNIDRLAKEGMLFTDYYAEQSCTAGRSTFITGQATGKVEDTGPLTKKRMETVDDETSAAAIDFIERQSKAGKPFFVWMNSTRMHFRTHVKAERRSPPGLTALTEYAGGMVEHDAMVGALLKKLDDLGIADNTIVLYTTDNGPHMNSWPDGAMTPFRSEKNTNWEGAFRVPAMIRWPGKIQAGAVSNDIVSGLDWLPTLLAAAGEPDITAKLLKGHAVGGKTFKVHLDGYNQLPYLLGEQPKSARRAPCGSGRSRSRRCACRSSSTCAPTPTSARASPRTPTTTGSCRRGM
mgnify:CR=1 FL=1